ncbi:MAG TPA: LLM class F420-dependent oxidoreductase [Ktedonobacterales bacterium]|nr:LLM class F420-dependent oxidoreductase [Ktedonobacterales bacterium]
MRVGLQVPRFRWPGGPEQIGRTFGDIARRAEDAGMYSLWVMDHFFQIGVVGPREEEMLEGWSALAFAAGKTERIRLGTMVTGVTYRHPGILVKTATTLDVLSGGRAYFGVGAAWNADEHRGLGIPFPPVAERFERLEELLQIAHQMWSDDARPYEGKYARMEYALNAPNSLQRPHPPILVGGGGEKKTLRLVAQYADACNLFSVPQPGALEHKLDVLREHCQKVGRPYEQIEKTSLGRMHITRSGGGEAKTPAEAIEYFQWLAGLGFDQAIISMPNVSEPDAFDLLAREVIPAVSELPVAGR